MAKKKPTKRLATKAKDKKPATNKPANKKPASKKPASKKPARRPKPRVAAAMFQKVAFTMLPVTDATRARAFYEHVLGLDRGLASADGVWTEYDLPGGGCLALFRHPDPRAAPPPGGASVALEVADLDALNERLKAAGVTYKGDVVDGPRCRMSNILDSEGNALILHQLTHA